MIQIVCCSFTHQKFTNNDVDLYLDKRFYQIEKVYVVPCPRHLYFKEMIRSPFSDIACNCLNLEKSRCNNCKIINFLTNKIKIARITNVSIDVEIKTIKQYFSETKSMLFFIFVVAVLKFSVPLITQDVNL